MATWEDVYNLVKAAYKDKLLDISPMLHDALVELGFGDVAEVHVDPKSGIGNCFHVSIGFDGTVVYGNAAIYCILTKAVLYGEITYFMEIAQNTEHFRQRDTMFQREIH